jgi:hypothetical protein
MCTIDIVMFEELLINDWKTKKKDLKPESKIGVES